MKTQLPFERVKREILLRRDAETSPDFGKRPEERTMEELLETGVICLNKHAGPTSHQAVDYLKKILHVEKAGHGGTLDPAVTGVLPVALGKSTRINHTLLLAGKEYVCMMHLHKLVEESDIEAVVKKFIGNITQLPPVRSAVKRQERQRKVHYMKVIEIDGQDVLFKIGCQAGTYVRKICHDIGQALGVGAHMAQLVRTKAGPFSEKEWYSLHDIQDAYVSWKEEGDDTLLKQIIKPAEYGVGHLPKVWILDSTVDTLCHGANLSVPGITKVESKMRPGEIVTVLTLKEELVAYGAVQLNSKEMVENEKGIAVKTSKVFMDPDTYPKFQKKKEEE